jgi:hypothetical protein
MQFRQVESEQDESEGPILEKGPEVTLHGERHDQRQHDRSWGDEKLVEQIQSDKA